MLIVANSMYTLSENVANVKPYEDIAVDGMIFRNVHASQLEWRNVSQPCQYLEILNQVVPQEAARRAWHGDPGPFLEAKAVARLLGILRQLRLQRAMAVDVLPLLRHGVA